MKNKTININITNTEVCKNCNCVYKLIFPNGDFIIGHTTQYLGDRINQYFAPSSKSHFIVDGVKDLSCEPIVLHNINHNEILPLLEQLEIIDAIGNILVDNGFPLIPPNKINNYHIDFACVKKSNMKNRRLDYMYLVRDYFKGKYKSYFDIHPFRFTYLDRK